MHISVSPSFVVGILGVVDVLQVHYGLLSCLSTAP
jgi:hypothetical protein